jgi:hypothetical protein
MVKSLEGILLQIGDFGLRNLLTAGKKEWG